ncbi:hypothetical protein FGG08_001491 [Glutinoglossum americanum]|uniref:Protein kinase domain-containing protein n=1 Tax=Glutinoglossum americanum TaxID=1670608 RepID=A0A9P8L593_9PEZI|nr:hypothetical protein FGG08_001491 [Glutinoglossum americanum]
MASLDAKHFLRRLALNASSPNPSTSPATASPTHGNGGGGAVSSPTSNGLYPLDGYKSLISKSKLASPRLHSEVSMLSDHGEDYVSTSPIVVPAPPPKDLDAPTPSKAVPIPPPRDFDGYASTPPIVVPTLTPRNLDDYASTPPIVVPTSTPRTLDGYGSTPPIAVSGLPSRNFDCYSSSPSAVAPASQPRNLDGYTSVPSIVAPAPLPRKFDGYTSAPSMVAPAQQPRHFGAYTSAPSTAILASPARDFGSAIEEDPAQENEPCAQPPSPEEPVSHHRSVSISFDPHVTLDDGHQHALDQPLPKPKSGIDIGLRGRSMLKELADEQTHTPPLRAHSDSERAKYDPITGEPVVRRGRRVGTENGMLQLQQGQSHYPLVQSTVDSLARNSDLQDRPRMPSLTSEITASPLIDEVRTPLRHPAEYSLSPLGMFPHLDEPTSLVETSAWPTVPRGTRLTTTHRSFSHSLDKRIANHRSRRTGSERSASGNSMSPASAYLSMWMPTGKAAIAQPDDEGQEVGAYVIGKQIGFGGFSVVKEAFTIENDKRVRQAVKIVRKRVAGKEERENEQLQAEFEHEVLLWRLLNHRHVLPLIAVYDTEFATFCFTQLNTGGTLFDLVRDNRQGLKSELAKRYSFQLASALRYLHEDMHVVHRDIKLENCLLDMTGPHATTDGGNLLLCDFGMAEFVTSDGTAETRNGSQYPHEKIDRLHKNIGPSETSTSIVGSLQYAAPELVKGSNDVFTTAVDMWAFGVVLFCLLTGRLPFQDTFQPRVPLLILRGDWDEKALRSAQGVVGSENAVVELVRGCLHLDIEVRWNVGQVLTCEWLENCKEEDDDGWKF